VNTEAKKKERFLNGLHDELQCTLVVIPFQDLESLADAAMMMEHKRQSASDNRKRKMMLQGGPSTPRTRNSPYARPPPPNRAPAFAPRPNNFAPRPNFYHNHPQYAPRPGGNYGGNRFGGNNGNSGGNNFNRAAKPNLAQKPSGGCFACGKDGHFARECPTKAAVPAQPNATKMNHGPPMKKQGWMKGNLNQVTTEEAQEAPDMVMGMFPVNSVPAAVLFDSGASHSFVTKPFVEKSGMNYSRLIKPMLVQIPGDSTKASHVCNEVPVVIQGKTFHADLIVLGSKGIEVVLGMNWMTKYKGVINCSRKSISVTTSDGDKVAYTATKAFIKGSLPHQCSWSRT
jgi:hypothetical protein